MAVTIQLWEDSGALIGTPPYPSVRQEVDNIGWKSSSLDETYPWVDYPITQPYGNNLVALSYPKYNYFKIQGTYSSIHNIKVNITGTPIGGGNNSGIAKNVRLLYKWTSVYEEPTNTMIDGTVYNPATGLTSLPLFSYSGPETATNHWTTVSGSNTFYTQYLVTQLMVHYGDWSDFGNLNTSFQVGMTLDERKYGLPEYEESNYLKWEW